MGINIRKNVQCLLFASMFSGGPVFLFNLRITTLNKRVLDKRIAPLLRALRWVYAGLRAVHKGG